MGRGIIHEPDDIRPDNPPSNPELLAYLEKELVTAHYDLRHIYRLILNSRTYQQSSHPAEQRPARPRRYFAYYPVRRLDAEVLIDALCQITGDGESYSSPIPEPFTSSPRTSGRSRWRTAASPARSWRCSAGRRATPAWNPSATTEPTDAQRLHLLNSTPHPAQDRAEPAPAGAWPRSRRGDSAETVRHLYLTILSRYPTPTRAGRRRGVLPSSTGWTRARRSTTWPGR